MMYFEGHFTQDDLDETLRKLGSDVFFVQIGANDGIIDDPISHHVKALNWRGLLVEPMPDVFAQLKTNYAMCDSLQFENVAITDFDGQIELLHGTADLGKIYPNHLIASVIEEQSFFGINDPALMQKLAVPCNKLATVLDRNAVRKLDLFVVDVEGADWIVTRQLPLDVFAPSVVLSEYFQLSSYEKIAFVEHFRNYGYRIYVSENGQDVLAVRWPSIQNTGLMRKVPFFADVGRKRH